MLILAQTRKESCHKQLLSLGRLTAVTTTISILKYLLLLTSSKMLRDQRQTIKWVNQANFYPCWTLTKVCKRLHLKDSSQLNRNTQRQILDTEAFLLNSSKKMPTKVYQAKITSQLIRVSASSRINLKRRMKSSWWKSWSNKLEIYLLKLKSTLRGLAIYMLSRRLRKSWKIATTSSKISSNQSAQICPQNDRPNP